MTVAKNKTTFTFDMAQLTHDSVISYAAPGALIDVGAPFSTLGEYELCVLRDAVIPDWDGQYELLPHTIQARIYRQYGTGNHASNAERILGSVLVKR